MGIGICVAQDMMKRVKELKELERIFIYVLNDIRYNKSIIKEVFEKAGQKYSSSVFGNWLIQLSDMLQRSDGYTDFYEIWCNSLSNLQTKSHMKKSDIDMLIDLGHSLNSVDVQSSENGIKLFLEEIHTVNIVNTNALSEKIKIAIILGSSAGILAVIIML